MTRRQIMTGLSIIVLAAVLAAVRPPLAAAEALLKTTLLPPVLPACISSAFGPRVLPNQPEAGTYHYGVDLPAPLGTPVLAAASGTVIRIQRKGPGGLEMLIQHDGFVGVYSHFGSIAPPFAEGKRTVAAGEKLGVVGTTGVSSGAHVYFAMILGGAPIDPAPYLRLPRCAGSTQTTMFDPRRTDGTVIGAHKYYQVLLPTKDYYDWHSQQ